MRPPSCGGRCIQAGALLGLVAYLASPAAAQPVPGAPADTMRVAADASEAAAYPLEAGEPVAAWVESDVRVADPGAGDGPVSDAAVGAVIARFGPSAWFAWPEAPIVWTAPRAGSLVFGLNGRPAHGLTGAARVMLVPLGPEGSAARRAFDPPLLELDRMPGGVRARYADRAGFGLDRKTLRFTLTTAHGTVFHLASWAPVGSAETILPLPPPDVPIPAGIHTLTGTITDRVGNDAPSATITFDAVQ